MAKRYDLLICKGLVVTGSGVQKADIGIEGEKITSVRRGLGEEEASQRNAA